VLFERAVRSTKCCCSRIQAISACFGSEMVTTFSDLISGEWAHKGLPGVARVRRSALGEVFSIAVPLQLQRSIVVATSLALLSSFALFMAIFYAMTHVCNGG
jgi:hypothetical protein